MKYYARKDYFLINRRERWGLSVYGWIFLLVIAASAMYGGFRRLFPTLAPVHREQTGILVLEGWVSDYLFKEVIREFNAGHYTLLITTGTPLENGDFLAAYHNTAVIAGRSLIKLGFDSTKLVMVATDEFRNERTYNSAIRLKQWLRANHPEIRAINVMTMGVHGARSQLLFQKALGDSVRVGIISVPNSYYGPETWWKTSKGFRETLNEAIGYFYVTFFFRPYEKELATK
ncbi:MAG: ElyC/SanA/YdcF family protein [Bacteroidota bacterium]